jgi:hypothetical protein
VKRRHGKSRSETDWFPLDSEKDKKNYKCVSNLVFFVLLYEELAVFSDKLLSVDWRELKIKWAEHQNPDGFSRRHSALRGI